MPSKLDELVAYANQATAVYRKGDVVTASEKGGLRVVTVNAFPEQPADDDVIDCHFVTVGWAPDAERLTDRQFYDLLVAAMDDPGPFAYGTSLERFAAGPSYIEVGGWVGDQTLAFRVMAVGALHHLWAVVTPRWVGATGQEADELAGRGLVMVSGLKEPAEATLG